jgi:hypothetical protein
MSFWNTKTSLPQLTSAEQTEILRQQMNLQAAQQAAKLAQLQTQAQYATITQVHTTNPFGPVGGPYQQVIPNCITSSSTASGPQWVQPPMPLPGQVAGWATPYYVQLPAAPREGDKITVHYNNGRWLEDRDVASERMAPTQFPRDDAGGFSLDELTEAEKIMDECNAA